MISKIAFEGSKNIKNIFKLRKFSKDFKVSHTNYFEPEGLLVFCGAQGEGKTLSAVQYVRELSWEYPKMILVSNVEIKGLCPSVKVYEYEGIDSLTKFENGYNGVVYLIDEIHLEFNSLESKNIPIEVMIEVSQQRKQRKHIVGTSQVFLRMAKPLREQIKNLVICKKIFGCIQYNKLIDGETIREDNGKVIMEIKKRSWWFHDPDLYNSYDTYAKMKRYRKEWKGTSPVNIYGDSSNIIIKNERR